MVDYAPVFDCYEYLCQNFICLGLMFNIINVHDGCANANQNNILWIQAI